MAYNIPKKPPRHVRNHIRKVVKYDKKTGNLIWINASSKSVKNGDIAGGIKDGYIRICFTVNGTKWHIRAHHIIWYFCKGKWPRQEIDHKNNVKTDNRIKNLRLANHSQNMHNHGKFKTNTSGYKGVYWHKTRKKWMAIIGLNNKLIHIGRFNTALEAAKAYDEAAIQYHGKFAKLNFPKKAA